MYVYCSHAHLYKVVYGTSLVHVSQEALVHLTGYDVVNLTQLVMLADSITRFVFGTRLSKAVVVVEFNESAV